MTSILKADTIQDTDGNNIINESGNTITIGASGDTTNIIGTLQNNGAAVGGTNTPAFEAYLGGSGGQSLSNDTVTKIQFNTEVFDSDGTYDASTNYRFTPGVAGKYFIYGIIQYDAGSNDNLGPAYFYLKLNGSTNVLELEKAPNTHYGRMNYTSGHAILDLSASDYVEVYGRVNTVSGSGQLVESDSQYKRASKFGAYRIIL